MNLNSHDWCNIERNFSFGKTRYVVDIIHQNFGGNSSVRIGIIYVAIGCNAGKSTERYLMFVPYYNPSIHGYNFNIQHPYVFARGVACTAPIEFYEWIDKSWTKKVKTVIADNNRLLECSPVLITEFENVMDASFKLLPWEEASNRSEEVTTMFISKGALECWVHGPANSKSFEKRLIANQIQEESSDEFMNVVNTGVVENIATFLELKMVNSNSFSFPTIHLRLTSPMTGLVPFPLKDVRLKIGGGDISSADGREEKEFLHIAVFRPGYDECRRISFQRLWCLLFDPTRYSSKDSKDICQRVRCHLNA